MSAAELGLLASFLRCAQHYFEFGAGGSTCLAASLVAQSVTAEPRKPQLIHVDIGPIRDWGYPADDTAREKWPVYHDGVWEHPRAKSADLFLVDGRFRVACFMQIILHTGPDSLIAIHDFASRKEYHVVREVAREIARSEDLAVFMPLPGDATAPAARILEAHRFVAG
jgi:hypothetical protein